MEFSDKKQGFLGIDSDELTDYSKSRVCVQSFPYENTSSYIEGSTEGPQAIIDASAFVEFYDEELRLEPHRLGIATQLPIDFEDCVDNEAIDKIYQNTKKHLEANKFVVSLGAEHTVSLGIFKAFNEKFPGVSVLQIDAHADLRDSYEGSKFSHASVLARINEYKPKICQVGIRALCKEEAQTIDSSDNITTIFGHELENDNLIDTILNALGDEVYITVDADGFDPSVMPAVGTIEPGGLLWFDALKIFKDVCKQKRVVGFDIVECAPRRGEVQTQYNLAQLAYKIIGYSLCQ